MIRNKMSKGKGLKELKNKFMKKWKMNTLLFCNKKNLNLLNYQQLFSI